MITDLLLSIHLKLVVNSRETLLNNFYSCLNRLTALEEVNLSSNRLSSISVAFCTLPNLQILRLHSNEISMIPDFSRSPSLVVRF